MKASIGPPKADSIDPMGQKIVGEDEADAAKGSVSHVSPMALALFGKTVGETATVNGKEWEIVKLEV